MKNKTQKINLYADIDTDTHIKDSTFDSKKKRKKKNKKKKVFSWNDKQGIQALQPKITTEDMKQAARIIARRARFEKNNNNSHPTHNTDENIEFLFGFENKNNLDFSQLKIIGTCTVIEKPYFRLTSEPQSCDIRTLATIKQAFKLLMIRWKTKPKKDYLYVGGQFKSIRQDLRVQHIRSKLTVDVYEENAKICLEVGDFSEYNQCQAQLKELYLISNDYCQNMLLFLSYRLLYESVTKNFASVSSIIKSQKIYLRTSSSLNKYSFAYQSERMRKHMQNVIQIIRALYKMDYYNFFRIYQILNKYAQYILDQILFKIRYKTVLKIIVSYLVTKYSVKDMSKLLAFKNVRLCAKYLRCCGCVLDGYGGELMLNCRMSRGKTKEFIPKSKDDVLGVTHGSVYTEKQQKQSTIHQFLRK